VISGGKAQNRRLYDNTAQNTINLYQDLQYVIYGEFRTRNKPKKKSKK
jgi:hypothetical protein